VGYHSHHL